MNRPKSRRSRQARNTFTTKSGQTIKVNRSLSDRIRARKETFTKEKALRMAGMPKGRLKRFFYRLQPKRLYGYWFSKEGSMMALKITGVGMITTFLLLVGLFAYFRKDLLNLRDITGNNIGGSIRYYDRTGEHLLWEDYDAVKRVPVHDEEIAQDMKDATVAIEDKDFFSHGGFDVRGITRAAWNNVTGGSQQGGSTITQQLVKLSREWTDERTYSRKVKELILAVELERTYTKQEILVGYLNTAPYGNVQYGVEAAARDYFDKSAKDLTLDESAFLAAIPRSPSYYSPYGAYFEPDMLVSRAHHVLDEMQDQGMITKEEAEAAKAVDLLAKYKTPKAKYAGITAPWFVLTAKDKLIEERGDSNGVLQGGWKVITTLDYDKQKLAEEQVNAGLAQIHRQGGDTAAFVAEDVETGQVVAMVGGVDFTNNEFNYARAKLPPGSSFKPYDYTALMESGDNYGAGTVLYDSQGPLEGYPCTNKSSGDGNNCLKDFDRRYPGPITVRYALGGSRNVPAVKAMLIAGVDFTIETAESLMNPRPDKQDTYPEGYSCYQPGDETLTKDTACFASSAIGDGAFLKLDEHVHGYASLSRNGLNIPQSYLLKVTDANNKTILEWKPNAGKQVVRADSAYIIGDMLSDPRASYFSTKYQNFNGNKGTWKFSMKTGTTNDAKDGWLMGFTTKYAAGVWVGDNRRQVVMRGAMETMTLPIWRGWMQGVHRDMEPVERQRPSSVQTLPAYIVRSHVGYGSQEPSPANDLFPGWYRKRSTNNQKQVIDIISNKLATDCTPNRARKEVNEGDPLSFSGDPFAGGAAANTSESDDVHQCSDARPGISVSATKIGTTYTISATISQGTHPLSGNTDKGGGKVNFMIDGNLIKSFEVSGTSYSFQYTPDFSGDRTLTAEIVDSVLYDATTTVTLNGNSSSSGVSGFQHTNGDNFSWSTYAGAASYQVCAYNKPNSNLTCNTAGAAATSTSVPGAASRNAAYIRALGAGGNELARSDIDI